MPQCQFLFSAVFAFQKSYTGNILGIGRNESQKVPIYLTRRWSPKERRKAARRQPHHRVAWATPWLRHQVVWAPGPPSDIALPPINSLHRDNPKGENSFPRNILQAAAIVDTRLGGSKSSSRHPAREGNHHQRPSSSPCQPPE
jgi:hypothetical protein